MVLFIMEIQLLYPTSEKNELFVVTYNCPYFCQEGRFLHVFEVIVFQSLIKVISFNL